MYDIELEPVRPIMWLKPGTLVSQRRGAADLTDTKRGSCGHICWRATGGAVDGAITYR